jgi:hypothetical protein
MSGIQKHETEKLKEWIINFINKQNHIHYANLSYYEDYNFVDNLFSEIFRDFEDYINAISKSVYFETIATDTNNKFLNTDCNIYIFNDVEKVFGRKGSIVYVKYDGEALWHSRVELKENETKAREYANLIIEMEKSGIETKIEELVKLKEEIKVKL